MDEPTVIEPVEPDQLQEWVTPELIVEDVKEITLGGAGKAKLLASEEKITAYYHS